MRIATLVPMTALLLLLVLVLLLLVPGCNTVKGFGKDVHDMAQFSQELIEGNDQNRTYIPPG